MPQNIRSVIWLNCHFVSLGFKQFISSAYYWHYILIYYTVRKLKWKKQGLTRIKHPSKNGNKWVRWRMNLPSSSLISLLNNSLNFFSPWSEEVPLLAVLASRRISLKNNPQSISRLYRFHYQKRWRKNFLFPLATWKSRNLSLKKSLSLSLSTPIERAATAKTLDARKITVTATEQVRSVIPRFAVVRDAKTLKRRTFTEEMLKRWRKSILAWKAAGANRAGVWRNTVSAIMLAANAPNSVSASDVTIKMRTWSPMRTAKWPKNWETWQVEWAILICYDNLSMHIVPLTNFIT